MDSGRLKRHSKLNARQYLKKYFSSTADKDVLQVFVITPIEKLYQFFTSESICGDTLIHVSYGPVVHLLFPICQYFKEMRTLNCNEECIKELRKWKNKDPDAHDWSFAAQIAAKQGDASKQAQDIEDMTRRKLTIEKSNLVTENPTSLNEIPQADCVLTSLALEGISGDRNAFRINLKNLSSVIKAGGYFILFGKVNTSYFNAGDDKHSVCSYDEGFLKKCLSDEAFTIKYFDYVDLKKLEHLSDGTRKVFVVAQKP